MNSGNGNNGNDWQRMATEGKRSVQIKQQKKKNMSMGRLGDCCTYHFTWSTTFGCISSHGTTFDIFVVSSKTATVRTGTSPSSGTAFLNGLVTFCLDSFHLFLNLHEIDLHLSGLLGKFVGFPHAVPRLAWEWTNCSSKRHGVHKFITANGNSSIFVIYRGQESKKVRGPCYV